MAARKPIISILVPIFNEELNILPFYEAISALSEDLAERYDFEILFSDNHSSDDSFRLVGELAKKDKRVKAVRYKRNYGFQRSLLTAYRNCTGAAAVQIDVDLQDPPTLIKQFIGEWERGADVVVGLRSDRDESAHMQFIRGVFYSLLDRISDESLTVGAGDFRLVDRSIINQLHLVDDHSPYVRGIVSSLSAKEVGIRYKRARRERGESKFTIRKLAAFAFEAVLAHSVLPLRVASYIGLLITLLVCAVTLFYLVKILFFGETWPSGLPTIVMLQLFTLGINGVFIGIVGEYVGRIHTQLQRRPTTVVESAINMSTLPWESTRRIHALTDGLEDEPFPARVNERSTVPDNQEGAE